MPFFASWACWISWGQVVGTGIGVSAGIFIESANGLAIYVPPE
jgi:hypothetical protein